MKAYIGPYFQFSINVENLKETPYPSKNIYDKLLAVARLRPHVFEEGKKVIREHVIAFVPRIWVVGISSISSDNVFQIDSGSIVEAQRLYYYEYKNEFEELEKFFEIEGKITFGFVCLD